jgi:hypothetical protein
MLLTDDAVTIIWSEYLRHSDARLRYSSHGQLYRTRLGGPDGEVLCDRVHNAISETCRVLMSLGILGTFETWKEDIHHACMRGDIETTAGLTVAEPDIRGRDCQPRFVRWRPYPGSQDGLLLHSVDAPAREEEEGGRVVVAAT